MSPRAPQATSATPATRPPAQPAPAPGRGSMPPVPPAPQLGDWQPVSRRGRWLLVLLALVTALGVAWLMLQPKMRLMAARQARGEAPVPIGLPTEAHRPAGAATSALPDRPACAPGQVDTPPGCVGGRMPVMVLPSPASR